MAKTKNVDLSDGELRKLFATYELTLGPSAEFLQNIDGEECIFSNTLLQSARSNTMARQGRTKHRRCNLVEGYEWRRRHNHPCRGSNRQEAPSIHLLRSGAGSASAGARCYVLRGEITALFCDLRGSPRAPTPKT
jgi:hypothetical protein